MFLYKNNAILHLISTCREIKQDSKFQGSETVCVPLKNESWYFTVNKDKDGNIYTKADCYYYTTNSEIVTSIVKAIHYPETKWGGPCSRWDTELREFCKREFEKGG